MNAPVNINNLKNTARAGQAARASKAGIPGAAGNIRQATSVIPSGPSVGAALNKMQSWAGAATTIPMVLGFGATGIGWVAKKTGSKSLAKVAGAMNVPSQAMNVTVADALGTRIQKYPENIADELKPIAAKNPNGVPIFKNSLPNHAARRALKEGATADAARTIRDEMVNANQEKISSVASILARPIEWFKETDMGQKIQARRDGRLAKFTETQIAKAVEKAPKLAGATELSDFKKFTNWTGLTSHVPLTEEAHAITQEAIKHSAEVAASRGLNFSSISPRLEVFKRKALGKELYNQIQEHGAAFKAAAVAQGVNPDLKKLGKELDAIVLENKGFKFTDLERGFANATRQATDIGTKYEIPKASANIIGNSKQAIEKGIGGLTINKVVQGAIHVLPVAIDANSKLRNAKMQTAALGDLMQDLKGVPGAGELVKQAQTARRSSKLIDATSAVAGVGVQVGLARMLQMKSPMIGSLLSSMGYMGTQALGGFAKRNNQMLTVYGQAKAAERAGAKLSKDDYVSLLTASSDVVRKQGGAASYNVMLIATYYEMTGASVADVMRDVAQGENKLMEVSHQGKDMLKAKALAAKQELEAMKGQSAPAMQAPSQDEALPGPAGHGEAKQWQNYVTNQRAAVAEQGVDSGAMAM